MTEKELDVLERIWKGETSWAPDWEPTLQRLAADGYIEIVEKRRASHVGAQTADSILVKITDEGSAHLSSSGY
jgi:hypothetical protein